MEVFINFYEKEVEKLKELYARFTEAQKRFNALNLALRQVKSEGDTSVEYAEALLIKARGTESQSYTILWGKVYSLKEFVRGIELELEAHGYEANEVEKIFNTVATQF